MEEKIIEESGLPFRGYPYFERKPSHFLRILIGIIRCLFFILRDKPQAVVASGSYACLPVVLAGLILGKRLFLLEQNRVSGTVTKLFSPFARYVFFGFPQKDWGKRLIAGGKVRFTGNPIRRGIREIAKIAEEKILVLGGSQGARRISQCFKEIAGEFPHEEFLIQIRREDAGRIEENSPENCQFFVFNPRVERLFSQAKVVVGRAGGSFLSEVLYLGIPALLIPYPYAAHNHQEENAFYCHNAGAAVMMREERLLSQREEVISTLRVIINDQEKREEMRRRARELGRVGTEDILAIIGRCIR